MNGGRGIQSRLWARNVPPDSVNSVNVEGASGAAASILNEAKAKTNEGRAGFRRRGDLGRRDEVLTRQSRLSFAGYRSERPLPYRNS